MDQLRLVMRWLKAHHFWVLSLVLVIVPLVCWYRAANALTDEYEANKRKILAEVNSQKTLISQPFHANQRVNQKQLEEIQRLADNVREAWQKLYDRQRNEVLKWPGPPELPHDFVVFIQNKEFGDRIRNDMRDDYLDYAKNQFDKLPKIVGAKKLDESHGGYSGKSKGVVNINFGELVGQQDSRSSATRRGADQRDQQQDEFLLVWADQGSVKEELNWETRPSSDQIWVTQENLWVYHTLLTAIANTNKAADADRVTNAAVRAIEALQVGKPAAKQSRQGRLEMLTGRSGQNGSGDEFGRSSGGSSSLDSPSYSDGGEFEGLLSGRYLDKNGQPLAVSGNATNADFGTEFKRLPVHMSLYMEQPWLTFLVAECANAPLPIEVQEVRIHPATSGSRGNSSTRIRSSHSDYVQPFDSYPNIVKVEIQGIVYIYNEPDEKVLSVDGAGI